MSNLKKFALALGFALAASRAQASDSEKKFSVVGSLLSYGLALAQKQEFSGCNRQLEPFFQRGFDRELAVNTFGVSIMDCVFPNVAYQRQGLEFRIMPSVMYSKWSAKEGLGSKSADELTVVPRVAYVKSVGPVKVDVMFGIGISYLSEAEIGSRSKSTQFQFSDEFGIGFLNQRETVRLGFSYRHVSNADIREPNNAVDFRGFSLSIRFP